MSLLAKVLEPHWLLTADVCTALELASQGNASDVDLLVSDIYGGAYDEYGLSSDTVAASLGKLVDPEVRFPRVVLSVRA